MPSCADNELIVCGHCTLIPDLGDRALQGQEWLVLQTPTVAQVGSQYQFSKYGSPTVKRIKMNWSFA